MNSKPLNLLLIEDDDDHAFLIQETIQQIGPNVAQVQRAMSLTEGLAKCKQQDYNIVLLDLGLPESTGLDTLKNFFLEDNTKTVVVLTSQTDLEIGAKAINMGAEDYLPKDALTPTILSCALRGKGKSFAGEIRVAPLKPPLDCPTGHPFSAFCHTRRETSARRVL